MLEAHKRLEDEYKQNFRCFWYTAADMSRPVNFSKGTRNCHVKIVIIDEEVGIQGNGNQGAPLPGKLPAAQQYTDGQSWYHSQEINLMVNSSAVCAEWRAGIEANQNTAKYGGPLAADGIWRDPKDGSVLEDAGNTKGGAKQIIKGIKGTIARVQGKGGF
jgi:phosphatidylserine/phosphatidylglycerophosphate/cardiolipin synthase-like enzyme